MLFFRFHRHTPIIPQVTRKSFLAAAALLVLLHPASCLADSLKAMTFNIRYGTAPDGENAWPHRRELVVKVIRDESPDILGVQEALRGQLDELETALPEYVRVGVGRDADGGGEYSALLYRKTRFDLSDAGTFWLSGTPEIPGSRTWGNNLPRIVTWARLLDRTNGRRFVAANTHWDHQSQPARLESAQLLGDRTKLLCAAGEPAIVTGDFNAAPNNPAIPKLLECAALQDSFRIKHPDEKNVGTFNGFGRSLQPFKIDAVLVSPHWQVEEAEIVRTTEGDRYPSDHFPVTATLTLP
jgi:endonuclease/exonuclease/phosphatase family metal-dependent hydrolase